MPGWAKALLITLGVVVVLVIGAIVVGIVYVARNKDAWRAKGREIVAQGREFGAKSDNQGCVDESIVRYKKERGFLNAFATQGFMQGCLEASRPTPGFCDKIPLGDQPRMTEWVNAQCRHYDLADDRYCSAQLFMSEVMFCAEKRRKEN